jgi:hypothetical protein
MEHTERKIRPASRKSDGLLGDSPIAKSGRRPDGHARQFLLS